MVYWVLCGKVLVVGCCMGGLCEKKPEDQGQFQPAPKGLPRVEPINNVVCASVRGREGP